MKEPELLARLLKEQIERNAELERENERLRHKLDQPANDDMYWTVSEASQALDVHINTIYRAIKSGELDRAVVRLGRAIRLKRAFMSSWTPKSTATRRSRKIT